MNSRKVLFTALLIIVAALSVATSSRTVKADAAPTKVVLDMDEYHFTIEGQAAGAPLMFKTGILYALTVKNTGKLNHEIWFGKDPQMGEDSGRLDGYKTNLLANVPVAIIGGEADTPTGYEIDVTGLIEIEEGPGQSYTIQFTFPHTLQGK